MEELTYTQRQERYSTAATHEIKQNISCLKILAEYGYSPKKISGSTMLFSCPWREDKDASLSISPDGRLFRDHGRSKGEKFYGGMCIDLVMAIENCSFRQAIDKILSMKFSTKIEWEIPVQKTKNNSNSESPIHILKVTDMDNSSLLNYLTEDRGIDRDVAIQNTKAVYYSIDKIVTNEHGVNETKAARYFAVGFPYDNKTGYALRNAWFKGSTPGVDITTINNQNPKKETLIFEGFTDYLSYLTLKKNSKDTLKNIVVLNSVNNLHKAIPFLSTQKIIHSCIDNDIVGKHTFLKMQELLKNEDVKFINQSEALYPNNKDFNEFLRQKRDKDIDKNAVLYVEECNNILKKNNLKIENKSSFEDYRIIVKGDEIEKRKIFIRKCEECFAVNKIKAFGTYSTFREFVHSKGIIVGGDEKVKEKGITSINTAVFNDEREIYIPKEYLGVKLTRNQRVLISENKPFILNIQLQTGQIISKEIKISLECLKNKYSKVIKKEQIEQKVNQKVQDTIKKTNSQKTQKNEKIRRL